MTHLLGICQVDGTWAGVQPRQCGPRQRAEARPAPQAPGSLGPRSYWALPLPDPRGGLLYRLSRVTGIDFTVTRSVSFSSERDMGVGKESRPPSDAGPTADQLCDLCLPLGPYLSSVNTSVVRSLCPQAWKKSFGPRPGAVGPASVRIGIAIVSDSRSLAASQPSDCCLPESSGSLGILLSSEVRVQPSAAILTVPCLSAPIFRMGILLAGVNVRKA